MSVPIINFKIANLVIKIITTDHVEILISDPAYRFFISGELWNHSPDVEINIALSGLPDLSGILPVNAVEDWDIYTRDGEYFIIKKPFRSDIEPLWLLKIGNDFKTGTLYCRRLLADAAKKSGRLENPLSFPLDNTLLTYLLAVKGGAIVHSAGIELNGGTFIFPGKSSSGKSTLSRQFGTHKDVICLSDDRMIVRKENGLHAAYGTPWPSDEKIAVNRGAPLAGIVFLTKAAENSIRRITAAEALQRFMPTVSIPWHDRQMSDLVLSFCDGLLLSIPAYELSFKPTPEVADFFADTFREKVAKS